MSNHYHPSWGDISKCIFAEECVQRHVPFRITALFLSLRLLYSIFVIFTLYVACFLIDCHSSSWLSSPDKLQATDVFLEDPLEVEAIVAKVFEASNQVGYCV